jgi:hypothetical protein
MPGLYHCMQGRIKEAFFWVILVMFLIPFVFPIQIALLLYYRSAMRLSKVTVAAQQDRMKNKAGKRSCIILLRRLPTASPLRGCTKAQATPGFPALGVASEAQRR